MGNTKDAESSVVNRSAAGSKQEQRINKHRLDPAVPNAPEWKRNAADRQSGSDWWTRFLNYTSDIIFTASIDGRISFINEVGSALIDYTAEEVNGQYGLVFVRRDFSRRAIRAFCQMLHYNVEGSARVEVPVVTKSGRIIWLDVQVYLTGESDPRRAICGVARDVSARKKLEQSLEQARVQAEEIAKVQRNFLGDISHEIRNPINSIVGMANLLDDNSLEGCQREYLDHIKHASSLLLSMISDVLDFTMISEDKMELCPEPLDLETLISGIAHATQYGLRDKSVGLELYIDPAIPRWLTGDAILLQQVLLNLLSNATKFTERGSVTLEVTLREETKQGVNVSFVVSDTGIGIPAESLPDIFDRYRQLSPNGHRRSGGIGLGLPITKRLVELMGGCIEVRSVLGEGTCFQICLPFERSEVSPEVIPDQPQGNTPFRLPELRVLIAEDNAVNRIYLEQTLRKWGMRFHSVTNGKEALDRLEEEPFDLCLLDIRMPVLDGLEMLSHLRRQEGHPNQHIPVIALTGAVSTEEREEALKAGVDLFLSKPFRPEALNQAIHSLWQSLNESGEDHQASFSDEPLNPNLLEDLYAGDKRHARIVFELFIKNMPLELEVMEDCLREGSLERFSALLHKIKPNFRMVGLDGLEQMVSSLEEAAESEREREELPALFEAFKSRTEKAMKGIGRAIKNQNFQEE